MEGKNEAIEERVISNLFIYKFYWFFTDKKYNNDLKQWILINLKN
jgi:hypothetical protein